MPQTAKRRHSAGNAPIDSIVAAFGRDTCLLPINVRSNIGEHNCQLLERRAECPSNRDGMSEQQGRKSLLGLVTMWFSFVRKRNGATEAGSLVPERYSPKAHRISEWSERQSAAVKGQLH